MSQLFDHISAIVQADGTILIVRNNSTIDHHSAFVSQGDKYNCPNFLNALTLADIMKQPISIMNEDWKRQYWEYMMSENYDAGFALKEENFPNAFFKYRKLNERTISNIVESYIWMADIASLNDPFECSLQFDEDKCSRLFFADNNFHTVFKKEFGKELSHNEIDFITTSKKPFVAYDQVCRSKHIILNEHPEKQIEKIRRRWSKIIEETNANMRICSFSETNDSLLMWSHYSDEHRGICIEYDLIEEDSEIRAFLQPIVYSDKVFKIELFEHLTTLRKIGSTLVKSKDWSYEREWRAITFRRGSIFPDKIEISRPKTVYLGTRFNLNEQSLKVKLFDILKKQNIPIYQMSKHLEEYKLIPQKNHIR